MLAPTASISVSAKTGDMSLDEAKEVITEMVSDGVHDVQQVQEPERRAHKPRIGTMGVRQMWNECVGEVSAVLGPVDVSADGGFVPQ